MARVHLSPDENGQWGNVIDYPYQSAPAYTLGNNCSPTRAVYVGGAGTVIATMADGTTATFTAIAGAILPISVTNISASSTATGIVTLY